MPDNRFREILMGEEMDSPCPRATIPKVNADWWEN